PTAVETTLEVPRSHTLLEVGDALAALPLPVAVVAAASNGARSCSTGTLTYVSYAPPLVATPLAKTSRTLAILRERGAFSIAVIAQPARLSTSRKKRGIPSDQPTGHCGSPSARCWSFAAASAAGS